MLRVKFLNRFFRMHGKKKDYHKNQSKLKRKLRKRKMIKKMLKLKMNRHNKSLSILKISQS